MDVKEIRETLYKQAEETAIGWSSWSPNEAYKEGFETGVDKALSAIDPEAIKREFWDELHAEAEAQFDHRHDVLRPVKTYVKSMIVHTMDDGWSAWLLAHRIIDNRDIRRNNES